MGEVRPGTVMEGDLTSGGEDTAQGTGEAVQHYKPETCVILLTSVTPAKSPQKKKS